MFGHANKHVFFYKLQSHLLLFFPSVSFAMQTKACGQGLNTCLC